MPLAGFSKVWGVLEYTGRVALPPGAIASTDGSGDEHSSRMAVGLGGIARLCAFWNGFRHPGREAANSASSGAKRIARAGQAHGRRQ